MELKVYSLIALLAIIGSFVPQSEAIMEDTILAFLEEVRNRMCYPLFGLPALDPMKVNHAKKFNFSLTASVTDLRLTGLSDFNVTDIKISAIPLRRSNFDIVLPLTSLNSLYTAKGSLAYIVNLNGDGPAEGHIGDLKVSISWSLKSGLSLGIRNLQIEISIGDLFVNIEDFFEEPRLNDFVLALINEMGIELLNDLWVEAQERGVIQYIENKINDVLGDFTLSDIPGLVGGGGEGGPPFGGVPADCKTKL